MIEVRRAIQEDWDSIVELSAQHSFPLPDFKNFVSSVVIVKDGKVIAFGYTKLFVEAVFLPDKSSKKNIVSSLKLVCGKLIEDLQETNVGQVHLFTLDPEFAEIMKRHYNFTDIEGEGLVLEVPNG